MASAPGGSGAPVSDLVNAKRQAQRFAGRLDLRVGEVMRFENNYYAELVGPGGDKATEVLVNQATGAVWLEYGPAMMWNTRYGMIGESRCATTVSHQAAGERTNCTINVAQRGQEEP